MESIVNAIISSYLADYLEINPEKTKLSILSGTVDLYGVKFKKNLFSILNLPYLELVDGFIGKIHVELSLPRFYLYPINVEVDKIYVKVKPKNMNKITEEQILNTFDIYKRKKLEQFEELRNIKFSLLSQSKEDQDKTDKKEGITMVENIINNLHIKIQNIVIIYDDCISNPKHPITFGVTLNRIFIDSTSKDFKFNQLSEEEKLSPFKYKKLSIEGLNVFLDNIIEKDLIQENGENYTKLHIREETRRNLSDNDKQYLGNSIDFYLYCESEIQYYCKEESYHSYLLRELNPEIKLTINEQFYDESNKEPQITGIIDIKTISLEVSNKQIKALTSTINYISLKDFYQQTTIDDYYKKVEKIDNELIKNYLEVYSQYYKTKYIEIYKNDKENKQFLEKMQPIEKNLKLDSIIALREMGSDVINSMIEMGKIDKEIKSADGGFFAFFGWKNYDEIEKLKKEREKKVKEQEELREKNSTMNQFKDYISGILKAEAEDKLKEDKIEFAFSLVMDKLNLIIKEEKKEEKMKKIFEIDFIKFKTEIILKTISQFIKLSLNDMKFSQFLSENKDYETILYSQYISEEKKEKEEASLILIQFEHNLKFPISPFKFKLLFEKQMFIIIDYYYLFYLHNLFLKHIQQIDFNNLSSFVNDKIGGIIKMGYDNLVKNRAIEKEKDEKNDKLFNLHVDISLTAPILLFPLNFRDVNNKQMLYISLGILKIKSELADALNNEKSIYDKYIVEFSNFIMKTIDMYDSKIIIDDKIGEKIIYESSFNIELQNYIYQTTKHVHKAKDFSPLIINIHLNNIKICLCEEQIIFLINYLANFMKTMNKFKKEKLLKIEKQIKKQKAEKISSSEEDKGKQSNEIIHSVSDNNQNKKNEEKIESLKSEEIKKEIIIEKEQEKQETTKGEISNILKLSIQFGSVQLFLIRNLNETKKTNFLSFFFQESFLNLLMTSDQSLNMEISFGHFFLSDEDIKINESTKKEESVINPEFKYIIGTTTFDFKNEKLSKVKFSEIYNYNILGNNSENNELSKESIKIALNIDLINKNIDIKISMCKLTISPNLSTINRTLIFLMKFLDIYNKSNQLLIIEQLKDTVSDKKSEFERSDTPAAPNPNNNLIENNKNDTNTKTILKTREKSELNIFFEIKGINLLMPIDVDSKNTYIIYMALEMPINYAIKIEADYFYSTSELIKIDYIIKSSQLSLYINDGNFSIIDYKDEFIFLNSKNKIFENFQISFLLINNLDKKEKLNKYEFVINLNKVIEFSININQIIIFQDLTEKVNEFLKELKDEQNKKISLNKDQEFIANEELLLSMRDSIVSEKEKNENEKRLKRLETKRLFPISFIDVYTYEINFSDVYIKFYDIIDDSYQSLFEFSMKNIKLDFCQNSNPQDSSNIIKYFKSMFSKDHKNKEKLDTYDKNNFYMYLKATTNAEIKSLNNYLNQWEYFVEPINVEFYFCQLLKKMRPNIELFLDKMLNINLSLNFAKILQFTLKKFTLYKEEIQKKKFGTNDGNKIIDVVDTPRYIRYKTPVLIFKNYTGVDMEIWFDNIRYNNNNKDSIIRIKSNEEYELTMDLLNIYNVKIKNNNLSSTISYKFCLEQNFISEMNINEKKLIGNNFNLNYHHIDIHDITNLVKVSIESSSDNLLIRHVIFSSLISIRNETKFQDLEINNSTENITINNKKRQSIPISWLLNKTKRTLNLKLNEEIILMKDLTNPAHMNRVVDLKNGNVIMIDIIKYKFNLDEYYINKNITDNKEDIYRIDLILTSPIYFLNNTPYDFVINQDEKIFSAKSLSSYSKSSKLFLEYSQIMKEKDKKLIYKKYDVILKILKGIKFQILYNKNCLSVENYLTEKQEQYNEESNEEGKNINNFSSYNKSILILLNNNDTKEYLICRLIWYNPYKSLSFDNEFYKDMNVELNSFRYEIVFDYYFINRTSNKLYFNNKSLDKVKASKDNILISAKKIYPLAKILLNNKIKFRKNKDDWTDNFEYSALGEEFVLNVKHGKESYNALSLMAKLSTTFKKSIIFTIEEKFMIINELPFDIYIKEEKLGKLIKYKSKEKYILLLDEETLGEKNSYRVGFDNCYSHMFDVSKLGSYDFLIEYDKTTFEKYNINPQDRLVEYDSLLYYPIRCVINNANHNTIYIIFSLNNQYINQLKNSTPETIQVLVHDHKHKKYKVRPEKTIPLVNINNYDQYEPFENVEIIFNGNYREKVNINEINNKYCGKLKNYYIKIQPEKNNTVKSIILYNSKDIRLGKEFSIKKRMKKFTESQGANILLDLEGIGFSIIDEKPKEIFYLSFYNIFLKYNYSNFTTILNQINYYNSLTFSIANIQLDYCLDNSYDIIFNPTNQILPSKSGEKIKTEKNFIEKVMENGDEDTTPFIQIVISQKMAQEKIDNKMKIIYTLFPEIAIMIQEFDVRINTILINCLINLISQYMKIFLPEEDNEEIDSNKTDKENEKLIIEDKESINDIRDKLLNKGENSTNLIINYLTLSAIKLNATFKINKNAIDIKYLPELFITILNTLFSSLTSFSDATIKLSELTFVNIFSDLDSLSTKLYTFYKNRLLAQIYKIVLNMDLIGNPVNLVKGLGTGIFEFFNEPRKGMLRGPEEFGIGIARGTRSLVSNIVGGGFNSVSKITGTLLNASKNLSSLGTDEEIVKKEEEKPRGFFQGTLSGFKKGFGELASGVTGIVTKPIEQTKKGGATGFFKGLGSGLLGAVLSPINTVLTVGNEVTTGISNSEFISNKKSLKRFRLPRTLYKYIPIMPYNEKEEMDRKQKRKELEGTNNVVISLSNESLYLENSTEIIMCPVLKDGNLLLVTNVMIKILNKEGTKFIKKIYVCNIEKIIEEDGEVQLIMKSDDKKALKLKNEKEKNQFIKEMNKFIYKGN